MRPTNKVPSTCKQWRTLFHSECKGIGFGVVAGLIYRGFQGQRSITVPLTKSTWHRLHRAARCYLRMNACHGDESWCDAICEMVFGVPMDGLKYDPERDERNK